MDLRAVGLSLVCLTWCATATVAEPGRGGTARTTAARQISFYELDTLDPAARSERRRAIEAEDKADWRARPPEGYRAVAQRGWLAFAERDAAAARAVLSDLAAEWQWLEDTFGALAPAEYARTPILVLHEANVLPPLSFRTEQAPRAGVATPRLACSLDPKQRLDLRLQLAALWFQEKDREVWNLMPRWMKDALRDWLRDAKVKNGSFTPDCSPELDDAWRALQKKNVSIPLAEVMLDRGDLAKQLSAEFGPHAVRAQGARTFAALAWGRGACAELLDDYLRALKVSATELRATHGARERLMDQATAVLDPWGEQEFLVAWDATPGEMERMVRARAWEGSFGRLDGRGEEAVQRDLRDEK